MAGVVERDDCNIVQSNMHWMHSVFSLYGVLALVTKPCCLLFGTRGRVVCTDPDCSLDCEGSQAVQHFIELHYLDTN